MYVSSGYAQTHAKKERKQRKELPQCIYTYFNWLRFDRFVQTSSTTLVRISVVLFI